MDKPRGMSLATGPDGLIRRLGGISWVETMYDEVVAGTKSRIQTIIINSVDGLLEETYQEMLTAIAKAEL